MVVTPTAVSERDRIDPLVDRIGIGGGTAMATGVDAGLDILDKEPGEKYMVLLTDGDTIEPPQVWDKYTRRAASLGVNWTSIAVGTDADQNLMRKLATAVGGQYFYCGNSARIPKVFINQARQIAKEDEQKREPFVPRAGRDFAVLKGFSPDEWLELNDA